MLGDVRRIAGRHYGFILANINRNILLADMPVYAAALDAVVRARNMDAAAVRAAMDQVFERLSALDVEIRRSLGR